MVINKIRLFPNDCRGCEHLMRYDLSVDDWTNICTFNGMCIDDCDTYYLKSICPIDKESLRENDD